MSRIGKKLIVIPAGVTVALSNGLITVKGPKGQLQKIAHPAIKLLIEEGAVHIDVEAKEEKSVRSVWGTFSAHVKNMVTGVTTGFQRKLEVNGVGYRVAMQGKDIKLDIGFSHPVVFIMPEGVVATVEKNVITLNGMDKEVVGGVASEIRSLKKPEPYKGKGIKYMDEVIIRKAGKAAKAAG